MYRLWVFLHLLGVFGFLLAHGVSVAVTFRLRRERDPVKVGSLIQLSRSSIGMFWGSTGLLLLGGIAAGFQGNWWSQGWIWASLGIVVLVSVAMFIVATPYYGRVQRAAEIQASGGSPVPGQDLRVLLVSSRALVVSAIGFAGLFVILWLMVFKPF